MPGSTVRTPQVSVAVSRSTAAIRLLQAHSGNSGCPSDVQTDVSTRTAERPITEPVDLSPSPARLRHLKAAECPQST